MKRGVTVAAASVVLLASCGKSTSTPVALPQQPSRVIYELREKCGKDANEWFKREHVYDVESTPDISTIQNEYSNHYNERLNRCYALVLNAKFVHTAKSKEVNTKSATLADVNENREVGTYFSNSDSGPPLKCSVDGLACGSKDEWYALAKPYMEQ